jgi:hypothetical protein
MRLRHPYNPHTQASEGTALLRFRREGGKKILRVLTIVTEGVAVILS